jgi:hypothetical protein
VLSRKVPSRRILVLAVEAGVVSYAVEVNAIKAEPSLRIVSRVTTRAQGSGLSVPHCQVRSGSLCAL